MGILIRGWHLKPTAASLILQGRWTFQQCLVTARPSCIQRMICCSNARAANTPNHQPTTKSSTTASRKSCREYQPLASARARGSSRWPCGIQGARLRPGSPWRPCPRPLHHRLPQPWSVVAFQRILLEWRQRTGPVMESLIYANHNLAQPRSCIAEPVLRQEPVTKQQDRPLDYSDTRKVIPNGGRYQAAPQQTHRLARPTAPPALVIKRGLLHAMRRIICTLRCSRKPMST